MENYTGVKSIRIREDLIDLSATLPDMMKYDDVCSALGINNKHLYKLLKSKKLVYVEFERGKRIPAAFLVAFLVEGVNCNRTLRFIELCYKEALYAYPKRLSILQVCKFLNVSKSTVKRLLNNNELEYDNLHRGHLILIYKNSLIKYLLKHTIR